MWTEKLLEGFFRDNKFSFNELLQDSIVYQEFDIQKVYCMPSIPKVLCKNLKIVNMDQCIPQIKLAIIVEFQKISNNIENLQIVNAILSYNELKQFLESSPNLESLILINCQLIEVFEVDAPLKYDLKKFKNLFVLSSEINYKLFLNCTHLKTILIENSGKSMDGIGELMLNSRNLEMLILKNLRSTWNLEHTKFAFKLKHLLFNTPANNHNLEMVNFILRQHNLCTMDLRFKDIVSANRSESLFESICSAKKLRKLALVCPGLQFPDGQVFQLKNYEVDHLCCYHENSGILAKLISVFPDAKILQLNSLQLRDDFSWRYKFVPLLDELKIVSLCENPITFNRKISC